MLYIYYNKEFNCASQGQLGMKISGENEEMT